MFKILIKKWIKNYNDVNNSQVREKYGTLCSTLSIICNIILVIFKFTIGVITNSIAIQADGLNNLSDVGSNLASLFGFKLMKLILMVMEELNMLQDWLLLFLFY